MSRSLPVAAAISVNDIGEYVPDSEDYSNALLCRSERPSGDVTIYPQWYIALTVLLQTLIMKVIGYAFQEFGWIRNRAIDSEDRHIVYLRRLSSIYCSGGIFHLSNWW